MHLIRVLSLDIVAGGVAGAAFAAHVTGARMPAAFWQVLPVAIWVMYTLDHLVDARAAGPRAANERHAFHARHLLPMSVAVALAGGAAAWRALALPAPILAAGVGLAVAVVLYLAALMRGLPSWLAPEFPVAAIYTAGLWVGPLALGRRDAPEIWLALALHGAVSFGYLCAYAWFEAPVDAADRARSIARDLGRARLARRIALLSALTTAVAVVAAVVAGPAWAPAFLALTAAAAVPWLMPLAAQALQPFDRYRHAEWTLLVLLVPVLLARLF